MQTFAEDPGVASADRVRRSTPLELNTKIDQVTDSNIQSYINSSHATIQRRIRQLDE